MNEFDATPYLDRERLLRECRRAVEEEFRRLRYDRFHLLPQIKAVVSRIDDSQLSVYFPESRTSMTSKSTAEELTSALLDHCGNQSLRIALWGRMPEEEFCELLDGVQCCGFTAVFCHEGHAILEYAFTRQVESGARRAA